MEDSHCPHLFEARKAALIGLHVWRDQDRPQPLAGVFDGLVCTAAHTSALKRLGMRAKLCTS